MTHEGELVNLAHYRLIRIEPGATGSIPTAPSEAEAMGRNRRNGKGAAEASLPLLVHITATGGKEAGTLRLTGDIPREDAELIMLKVADELRAIGYVEDHDEDEAPAPAPKKTRRSSAPPPPPSPPAPDEEPAPRPRRGRKPKAVVEAEKAAAAAAA